MTNSPKTVHFLPELEAATGKFDFPMTNDYMFRAVLQSNNKALTGLISSLLHIPPEDISSVEVTNPIILGDACQDKEIRLDINVVLNNRKLINLEMQVERNANWADRSLVYLCRNLDSLLKGQDYCDTLPVIHIGILDFTLFKGEPEFYATNKFMNTRTHKIYSDKLTLHVLDLRHTELATEEDKAWGIDHWAELFKATTWEGLKMIAQNSEYMAEASNSIFRMNADDMMRKRCLDREEYYRDVRGWKKQIEEQTTKIEELGTEIEEKDAQIEEKDAQIEEMSAELADTKAAMAEMQAEIARLRKQSEGGSK
ncbi:MAG: Rpn family recombination-promoting nuclease/putative transposase [Acetatifactor sp.]|nr:Rpn family recombination-promoting nuclease/putative transposase [Acetatifactor sp.]